MERGELTRTQFNILARKLTKIVFCMGGSYKEQTHVLGVVVDRIFNEIAERSPKVLYHRMSKKKANRTVIKDTDDMSFFPKLVEDLNRPR